MKNKTPAPRSAPPNVPACRTSQSSRVTVCGAVYGFNPFQFNSIQFNSKRPIPGRRTRQVPERTAAGRTGHDVQRRSDGTGTLTRRREAAAIKSSSRGEAGRPRRPRARVFERRPPLPPPAPSPRTTGRVRARAPRLLARISSSPVGRLVLCLSQRACSGARACSRPARQRSHVASDLLRGGEPRARAAARSAHVPVARSTAPPVALWPERRQAHIARELLKVTLPDARPLVG